MTRHIKTCFGRKPTFSSSTTRRIRQAWNICSPQIWWRSLRCHRFVRGSVTDRSAVRRPGARLTPTGIERAQYGDPHQERRGRAGTAPTYDQRGRQQAEAPPSATPVGAGPDLHPVVATAAARRHSGDQGRALEVIPAIERSAAGYPLTNTRAAAREVGDVEAKTKEQFRRAPPAHWRDRASQIWGRNDSLAVMVKPTCRKMGYDHTGSRRNYRPAARWRSMR